MKQKLLLAVLSAATFTAAAHAQNIPQTLKEANTTKVQVFNKSTRPAWVTFYLGSGHSRNVARGCILQRQSQTFDVTSAADGAYYLFVEFKNGADCSGPNFSTQEASTKFVTQTLGNRNNNPNQNVICKVNGPC